MTIWAHVSEAWQPECQCGGITDAGVGGWDKHRTVPEFALRRRRHVL